MEKSAIDLVIISADLEEDIVRLEVDEKRVDVLTKITKNRKEKQTKTESDHNILECELNLKLQRKKVSPKEELYNLKDKSCQEKFKEYTNTTKIAKVFDSDKNIDLLAKKFINILDGAIIKCFNKVRNTKGRDAQLVKLY